jgi:EAL domain-containing protein (putative c-di-GMP-specific phosphodiesterase class I)
VDGSFVRNICNSASDVAIVAASVCIATNLGLRLVAEGVETAEQRERLRKLGCHDCQGYYIGGPMPAAALEKVLGSKHRPARTAPPRLVLAR